MPWKCQIVLTDGRERNGKTQECGRSRVDEVCKAGRRPGDYDPRRDHEEHICERSTKISKKVSSVSQD